MYTGSALNVLDPRNYAVVREQSHLGRHCVHQQLRRLRRAPDMAGPWRRWIDKVNRQQCVRREEIPCGGAETFQDARAAWPRTDDGNVGMSGS